MEDKKNNERYYNLLLRRENIIKEGKKIYIRYIEIFGDLLIERYQLLMEIAKLRKMIAYCVKKQNYGEKIDSLELDEYIENEMADYQRHLNELINLKADVECLGSISMYEEKECKKLYYAIAKKIHPDLHPDSSEEMIKIFEEAKEAYEDNNIEDLKRIYDFVSLYVDEEAIIIDIEDKIFKINKEIDELQKKEPYVLKYEYEPEEVKKERIKMFKDEIESSKIVLKQLDEEFEKFEITDVVM